MLPHAARCDRRGKKSLECWQKSGRTAPISTSPPHLDLISVCFDTFFFDHVTFQLQTRHFPKAKNCIILNLVLHYTKRLLAKWVQLAYFCKRKVLGMEWTMWGQTVKKWPLPVLALSGQHIFGLASKGNERQSVKNLELTAELFRESDFSRAALKLAQRLISLLKLQRSIRVTLK